jgi:hypothetical protein
MARRASRVDANQREIVQALRDVGALVQHTHELGRGCPDLLVAFRGHLYWMEIKTPTGTLTADEREWHRDWAGTVYVVRSVDDALRVIGAVQEATA